MNNDDVTHFWANQVKSSGKTGNGSLSFEGSKLYSYSKLIGVILPDLNVTLLWSGSYSVTTSNHQSLAKRSANGRIFEVPDLGSENYDPKKKKNVYKIDHAENLKYFKDEIKENILKAKRATKNAFWYMRAADDLINDYNTYINYFNIKRVKISIESFNVEPMIEKANKQRVKAKRAKAKKDKIYLKEQQERIDRWISGDPSIYSLNRRLPCYLRINEEDQTIETSQGANIPISFAALLWRKIKQVIKAKKDYMPDHNHSFKVGRYTLDRIFKSGDIKIGCHKIPFSELKRMSLLLEY